LLSAIVVVSAVSFGLAGGAAPAQTPAASSSAVPTFAKEVAPILYKNCTACHRAGEMAPMSLVSYEEIRPWARSIRDRVSRGSMPPWHAEAPLHTFDNERRLTAPERDTLLRWVDAGAPEGQLRRQPFQPGSDGSGPLGRPDLRRNAIHRALLQSGPFNGQAVDSPATRSN
jgi:mono/diheme cytochrome c family protein